MMDLNIISELESKFFENIKNVKNLEDLENIRIEYLGKKGFITEAAKSITQIDQSIRKEFGTNINKLKNSIVVILAQKKEQLSELHLSEKLSQESLDVTLPIRSEHKGNIHPISYVLEEVNVILRSMGFTFVDGSSIEDDYHNFTALNIPDHHPAREMQDTFYINHDDKSKRYLLRTHTSSVQIRTLENNKPPLRIFSSGKVYRSESDATHSPMFHQVEGLCLEPDIDMGHLKGCVKEFLERFFEIDNISLRFRPSFFPFTEPSAEVDIGFTRKNDGSIQIGGSDNWLEILGCGMVHPNVLNNLKIDSTQYQGFAFGIGIERIAMLKYGIPDLRKLFTNDVRWLKHYGFGSFNLNHFFNNN